jgi:outer membrane protein assembly factor BamB
VIAEICGVRQYVQMTDASVAGLAPEDGRLLWRAPRQGKTATITTPIVYADHVYVTSDYGVGCNLFKITKSGDDLKAEQVYANHEMENQHGGVVRIGEYIYGHSDSKNWICQEFKTGKLVWRETSKLKKGSIAAADGLLFLRAEEGDGTVVMIAASPEGFMEKGRFDQPDRSNKNSWPHPVIANSKLYLRDQGVLLCYELK